jgi:peptidoglycan-associated lipoprotein
MRKPVTLYIAVAMLLVLAGCASPKAYVVLMENQDGTTGAVTVSNNQGSQVIDRKGYRVDLYDFDKPLKAPYQVGDEKIKADFDQAIKAQPDTPFDVFLYFELSQAVLTKESQQQMADFLTVVKKRTVPTVGIVGHTDLTGEPDFNYTLGLSRAEYVRDQLLKAGIPAASIVEVTSHGETNPLIKTAKGVHEPRNRRVEVTVW